MKEKRDLQARDEDDEFMKIIQAGMPDIDHRPLPRRELSRERRELSRERRELSRERRVVVKTVE